MSDEVRLTNVGNLSKDPEKIVLNDGTSAANFTVIHNRRLYDRDTRAYKDGPATFYNCKAYQALADHIAASLHKGDRIIVTGSFAQRAYKAQDGGTRRVFELVADEVGPSLKFANATVERQSSVNSQYRRSAPATGGYGSPATGGFPPSNDPFAANDAGVSDEPEF